MRAESKGKNFHPSGVFPFPLADFPSPPTSSSSAMLSQKTPPNGARTPQTTTWLKKTAWWGWPRRSCPKGSCSWMVTTNRWDYFKANSIELFIATVCQVGAKLPRAHLAAGRPGQDANLLEQGDRGDETRHFHHKNGEVHFSNLIVALWTKEWKWSLE